MSADNWAYCPQCAKNSINALEEAYGKVPLDEWLELSTSTKKVSLGESLREDYQIGIYDGEFHVGYKAGCRVCGFSYNFRKDVKLPLDK